MAAGYLILRVDGVQFTEAHPLRDPRPATVARVAREHGYETAPPGTRPEGWPLTIRCYTSKTKNGIGRCGSQTWSYPARRIEPATG